MPKGFCGEARDIHTGSCSLIDAQVVSFKCEVCCMYTTSFIRHCRLESPTSGEGTSVVLQVREVAQPRGSYIYVSSFGVM
jgi:hypothetical protein